jgi:type IV fimbrial biogenesis protein FimT
MTLHAARGRTIFAAMQTLARIEATRRMSGFTLLEAMFVVSIAAIILAVGVPSMSEFARNNRMTGAANDMLAALYLARAEAIKLHAPAVMCFSANPNGLNPTCNGSPQDGWIVFVDDSDSAVVASTDNNGELDLDEPIVARHGPLHDSLTVRTSPDGNAGYVSYNPAGYARENALGEDFEDIVICDMRGNTPGYSPTESAARGLTLSNSGRPSITRSIVDITSFGDCP